MKVVTLICICVCSRQHDDFFIPVNFFSHCLVST